MLVLTCIGIYLCNTAQLGFYQLVLCQMFMFGVKSSETENHINSGLAREDLKFRRWQGDFLIGWGQFLLQKSPQGLLQAPNLGVHSGANPPSLDFWMLFGLCWWEFCLVKNRGMGLTLTGVCDHCQVQERPGEKMENALHLPVRRSCQLWPWP